MKSTFLAALLAGAACHRRLFGRRRRPRLAGRRRRRPACRRSRRSANSCFATSPCPRPAACPARPATSRNSPTRRRPATSFRRVAPAWTCPGIRNSPSIRYASFTPPFGYDEEGTAFGGFFRDGRVPTLAEQAKQPFLDAREMANATPAEVIARLARSPNAARFRAGVRRRGARRTGCGLCATRRRDRAVPGREPGLSPLRQQVRRLPRGQGRCFRRPRNAASRCSRIRRRAIARPAIRAGPRRMVRRRSSPTSPMTMSACRGMRTSRPTPIPRFFDLGLCGPERKDLAARRDLCGAFKVPSLRNVARTAPYFHNGAFDSLREAVDFYVRRDTDPGALVPEGRLGRAEVRRPARRTRRLRQHDRGALRPQGRRHARPDARGGRRRRRVPRDARRRLQLTGAHQHRPARADAGKEPRARLADRGR